MVLHCWDHRQWFSEWRHSEDFITFLCELSGGSLSRDKNKNKTVHRHRFCFCFQKFRPYRVTKTKMNWLLAQFQFCNTKLNPPKIQNWSSVLYSGKVVTKLTIQTQPHTHTTTSSFLARIVFVSSFRILFRRTISFLSRIRRNRTARTRQTKSSKATINLSFWCWMIMLLDRIGRLLFIIFLTPWSINWSRRLSWSVDWYIKS